MTFYTYPYAPSDDSPTTGEIEIQVALPLGPLTLETSHFLDFWKNPGGYVGEVGCEYETGLAAGLTFAAAARLFIANSAFNRYYIPYDRGAVHAIVLELGWTVRISESVTVRPHVEWNRFLDSRAPGGRGRLRLGRRGQGLGLQRRPGRRVRTLRAPGLYLSRSAEDRSSPGPLPDFRIDFYPPAPLRQTGGN